MSFSVGPQNRPEAFLSANGSQDIDVTLRITFENFAYTECTEFLNKMFTGLPSLEEFKGFFSNSNLIFDKLTLFISSLPWESFILSYC